MPGGHRAPWQPTPGANGVFGVTPEHPQWPRQQERAQAEHSAHPFVPGTMQADQGCSSMAPALLTHPCGAAHPLPCAFIELKRVVSGTFKRDAHLMLLLSHNPHRVSAVTELCSSCEDSIACGANPALADRARKAKSARNSTASSTTSVRPSLAPAPAWCRGVQCRPRARSVLRPHWTEASLLTDKPLHCQSWRPGCFLMGSTFLAVAP